MLGFGQLQLLLLGVCLIPCVAAGAGDDFSNNLFTDLAPLLALFGERVTMQYMSQAMGWADNIILAMAPLGIITATVGAIRIGGPSWLKTLIGRARESRAIPEAELMSSTSKEVCELWNGHEIVRVMGEGPIREFIILLPEGRDKDGEQTEAQVATPTETSSLNGTGSDSAVRQCREMQVMALGDRGNNYLDEHKLTIRERILGKLTTKGRDVEEAPAQGLETAPPHPGAHEGPDDAHSDNRTSVVVIRNNKPDVVPNLTLNVHSQLGRMELYVVAACGLVLQLGVIAYFGITAKRLKHMFLKNGHLITGYAFPCTAVGTLLLVSGILICAHVVESSTLETRYCPVPGREARIVWLQRSGTVNDQAFESFAIFPNDAQSLITTSRRAPRRKLKDLRLGKRFLSRQSSPRSQDELKKATSVQNKKKVLERLLELELEEIVAVIGTMVTLCGFIVQFIGLRGMHWSASIAQLGAIGVMTILRAWVRRNLAQLPKSQPLMPGYELDWLAMTLGVDHRKAPWQDPSRATGDKQSRPWTADGAANYIEDCWDWIVPAVQDPANCAGLNDGTNRRQNHLQEPNRVEDMGVRGHYSDGPSRAYRVMKVRRDLGKLADWRGPASMEAITLASAIEITMEALFSRQNADENFSPQTVDGNFSWSLQVGGEPVHFRLERGQTGSWKAYSDEIEAALSLWLYTIHNTEEGLGANNESSDTGQAEDDDAWLRAKGTLAKRSLQLLGTCSLALQRDLRWWVPHGAASVIEIEKYETTSGEGTIEVEAHRIVGFVPGWTDDPSTNIRISRASESGNNITSDHATKDGEIANVILAAQSYSPLKTLFAQYMFSAFMWAAAKTMPSPVLGGADILPTKTDVTTGHSTWQSFALHNTQLSRLAKDIQSTGLGSLEEIYLGIIPPLSIENKLPCVDAIVEWAWEHAKSEERLGHWREAGEAYLWLFRTAKNISGQNDTVFKATTLLVEYVRRVTHAIELRKDQRFERIIISELESLLHDLTSALKKPETVVGEFLKGLMGLYKKQGRSWKCDFIQKSRDPGDQDEQFRFTRLHKCARDNDGASFDRCVHGKNEGGNEKDILGWTPLHYAAASEYHNSANLQRLVQLRVDVNARDVPGRTPLHYACQQDVPDIVYKLLLNGAEVNIQDTERIAPMHIAAMHGCSNVVRLLIEAGADIDVVDGLGYTPLFWAAYKGQKDVVDILLKDANTKLRDHNGRTPLHLATMVKRDLPVDWGTSITAIVKKMDEETGVDRVAKDRFGRTPLHLAAVRGHETVVEVLVKEEFGEHVDSNEQTPLHIAAEKGHEAIVEVLITAGSSKDMKPVRGYWFDHAEQTPLHLAAANGHEHVVELLLNMGKVEAYRKKRLPKTQQQLGPRKRNLDFGNETDRNGRTPLYCAAENGHEDVVKLLLKWGKVKTNESDYCDQTPVHSAAANGHRGVVKLLLDLGKVEVDTKDESGQTPLCLAAKNGYKDVVELLHSSGKVEVDTRNKSDKTSLCLAAENGHEHVVELLLKLDNVEANTQDDCGQTPLHLAAKNGHEHVVELLLKSGKVEDNTQDNHGQTPLHLAAVKGHEHVVELLLSSGKVKTNRQNDLSQIPLLLTATKARKRIVKLWLTFGKVKVNIRNNLGQTPLELAVANRHEHVAELLRSVGAS